MRAINFLIISAFLSLSTQAQEIIFDQFTMGAGYENMIYYNVADGVVGEATMASWDLSFDVRPMGSSVRINCGMGHLLYFYGELDQWETASIEGWELPEPLRNDQTNWSNGAFNQGSDPTDDFDLGWGIYDFVTHIVSSDKMYVLLLPSGVYKKIAILSLNSGVYTFKYANMDGTDEHEVQITKNDFSGKLHAFYNIENNEILDLEPTSDWDFLATRYVDDLGGEFYYGVTGILTRDDVASYQVDNLLDPFTDGEYNSELLSDSLNGIGHDWKTFTMGSGFSLDEDRCYFVYDNAGVAWRIVFTLFDGSATGNVELGKVFVQPSDIDVITESLSFNLYPNPISNNSHITISDAKAGSLMRIVNATGSLVYEDVLNSSKELIEVSHLEPGIYLVECTNGTQSFVEKLVIQ